MIKWYRNDIINDKNDIKMIKKIAIINNRNDANDINDIINDKNDIEMIYLMIKKWWKMIEIISLMIKMI